MASHSQRAMNHNENREKVCIVCLDKGSYNITPVIVDRIRTYFLENYDPDDDCCPAAICAKCRSDLQNISTGKKSVAILPDVFDFSQILPHVRVLRSNPHPICDCFICETARTKAKTVNIRQKGRPRSVPRDVFPASEKAVAKLCTACKGVIHRGVSHKCNVTTLRSNMIDLCSSLDSRTKEVVASRIVRQKCEEENSMNIRLKTRGSNDLPISLKKSDLPSFSADDMSSMQLQLGASNNCMVRKVMPFIRKVMKNRTAVEPNTTEQLRARDQKLSDYFSVIFTV